MKRTYVRIISFATAMGICLGAGQIGSAFAIPEILAWYLGLAGPGLNPPAWVFDPVWMVLYIPMGIALYLVWSRGWGKKDVPTATTIFGLQLILSVLWSLLFFGLQAPFFALIGTLFLWMAILMTIVAFSRISVGAAVLLIPYLLWVTFMVHLNYSVYVLNP